MSNPNPHRGKKITLSGISQSRKGGELPALVIDSDGRAGRFKGNHVLLDTGESVEPDGFMVVWPNETGESE